MYIVTYIALESTAGKVGSNASATDTPSIDSDNKFIHNELK